MRNKILIAVACCFLALAFVSPLIRYCLCKAGLSEYKNTGNVIEVEKTYENSTLLNSIEGFKRDVKDIYINYIPGYFESTGFAGEFEQNVNRPVSSVLLKKGNEVAAERRKLSAPAATPAPAPMTPLPGIEEAPEADVETPAPVPAPAYLDNAEVTFLSTDASYNYYRIYSDPGDGAEPLNFYVRVPLNTTESLRSGMQTQAGRYNRIVENYGVNLYVYPATTFHDTEACDYLLPSVAQHGLFEEFFSMLDRRIGCAYSDVDTLDAFAEKFWRTDIHWNNKGYSEAYGKTVEMFAKNYDDITPREAHDYSFDDVEFFGSYALALSNYRLSDTFGVTLYDLPEHEFTAESKIGSCSKVPAEQNLESYLDGNIPPWQTYNHYMQFFRIGHEIRYPGNNTGRNLLLLCDSFSPPLQEAIASHFDVTYLRYTGTNQYSPLETDLSYYVDECGVTDVLVLEMSDRAIYDMYKDSLKNLKIS